MTTFIACTPSDAAKLSAYGELDRLAIGEVPRHDRTISITRIQVAKVARQLARAVLGYQRTCFGQTLDRRTG